MAAAAVISFPRNFLQRPEDRLFLAALHQARIPEDRAELMLYRIWRDFDSGGSDRRPAVPAQFALLAQSAGFPGDPADLIRMAEESGFIRRAGDTLVCHGFSASGGGGMTMQRKGAFVRARNAHLREAVAASAKQNELWSRTNPHELRGIDEEKRSAGIILLHRLARAIDVPIPPDAEMRVLVRGAIGILDVTPVKTIDDMLVWLLANARDRGAEIPRKLGDLIVAWPSLVSRSGVEAS